MPPYIFLDHQAGAPLSEGVRAAMLPFLNEPANPASHHRGGVRAREALDLARREVATLIGAASPEEIVFTASGTESVNLALLGYARANRDKGTHLLLGATEHRAVLRTAAALEREGFTVTLVPVDAAGLLSADTFLAAARAGTILAAVHWANHEIGTIEPIAELASRCAERSIAFFTDAGAAAGSIPIDVAAAPVSLLSLSAHRFGGPQGAGALYRRRGIALEPLLHGGEQEGGLRAGTENLPAIVGMGAAAAEVTAALPSRQETLGRCQRLLLDTLRATIPGLLLNGPEPGPLRNAANLNVGIPGLDGEALVLLCDMRGLALSSGALCVSREERSSHVLAALGLPPERSRSNVLFTLGAGTTGEEIAAACAIVSKAAEKLRAT
ncbi:cysteine desulfurase [Verrucomicrobium sp. GAS474]|uniref:cysteine desulfurase family protein n=1 Tax=Verrucomicrobium sp. GAS474 TaxID=1882831 RepID=UPI00087C76E8|nr:cysteine desulfurase family protein [Verrucomicrobium sp. GAS474]SDU17426.1 cysteine desulfurase [Verrucomicrobium sp. GAS474]